MSKIAIPEPLWLVLLAFGVLLIFFAWAWRTR